MARSDQLEPDKLRVNRGTGLIGREVIVFASTSSTNDIAAEYAREKSNDGLAVFAEEQTAGRGRAANKWFSGRGDSLLCSVLLTSCPLGCELLSLTAAVAVAEAIDSRARIKWPNDIFLNGKKVAGILLESRNCDYGLAYIIGIGINCHQQHGSFRPELRPVATSIDIETGTRCDRISLARRLLACLDQRLASAQTDADGIIEQWRQRNTQLGNRTTLVFNGQKFSGNCIGVDPDKGLILQLESGLVKFFNAAQTTIAAESARESLGSDRLDYKPMM